MHWSCNKFFEKNTNARAIFNPAACPETRLERVCEGIKGSLYMFKLHDIPVFKMQFDFAIFITPINIRECQW